MKKGKMTKETRMFNRLMNNVSYTFGAYTFGVLADFLVNTIIFLISIPFDTLENTGLIYRMFNFAGKFGNIFYNIGVFFSIIFLIRCVFLYNSYIKETKKAC